MDATPIGLIEAHFDVELDRRGLKRLQKVPDGEWIEFAKAYQGTMDEAFRSEFIDVPEGRSGEVRLYFEPTLSHRWDAAVRAGYPATTPLLGLSPDPQATIDADSASIMLEPLKRHLLLADSVFVRDSFYYCFDWLADYGRADASQDDSVQRHNVPFHVARLKAWLPLLIELRPLIETRALVFMPYWLTPGFRDRFSIDRMNELKVGIRRPPRPPSAGWDLSQDWDVAPVLPPRPPDAPAYVNEDEVVLAWLNARLLGLNPVFPDRSTFDFASTIYFRDDEASAAPLSLTSDLLSLEILPLGKDQPVSIKDLLSLRKDEEGFAAVRGALTACQERLHRALKAEATQDDARALCDKVIEDHLTQAGGTTRKVVRLVNQNVPLNTALSIAVSAAMIPTAGISAAIGIFLPALLSPAMAELAGKRQNPEVRALTQLQAIL